MLIELVQISQMVKQMQFVKLIFQLVSLMAQVVLINQILVILFHQQSRDVRTFKVLQLDPSANKHQQPLQQHVLIEHVIITELQQLMQIVRNIKMDVLQLEKDVLMEQLHVLDNMEIKMDVKH